MNFDATLRRELGERARSYAQEQELPHSLSYGESPVVCFEPYDGGSMHGNFMPASYKTIQADPAFKRRLAKVHTLGHRSFPRADQGRWIELDTCTSSDALLMNIFCYPVVVRQGRLANLLGLASASSTCFGYRAHVPLANGRSDRTEVDLRLGNELIEAKLTESDFQSAEKKNNDRVSRFHGNIRFRATAADTGPLRFLSAFAQRPRRLCAALFFPRSCRREEARLNRRLVPCDELREASSIADRIEDLNLARGSEGRSSETTNLLVEKVWNRNSK